LYKRFLRVLRDFVVIAAVALVEPAGTVTLAGVVTAVSCPRAIRVDMRM
jgi:hypothetical protein